MNENKVKPGPTCTNYGTSTLPPTASTVPVMCSKHSYEQCEQPNCRKECLLDKPKISKNIDVGGFQIRICI